MPRFVLIWLFVVCSGRSDDSLEADSRRFAIAQKDYVVTEEEASRLNLSIVSPILQKVLDDPKQNLDLKAKLLNFLSLLRTREIFYFVSPAFFPTKDPASGKEIVAKVEIDPKSGQLGVILFMPAVLYWKANLRQKEFEYLVAITFAHESIHLEIADQFRNDHIANEAYAWWLTIRQLIRPIIASEGIRIDHFTKLSNRLAGLGDNWMHPGWLNLFR